ncbi:MAG: CopD family protein [Cyclobacteriaceae bacterium]
MDYLSLKALHIIFVVTWFAGLFYLPRIQIYQTEAFDKPEPEKSILSEQLNKMARLLLVVITWPSAILTAILAGALLYVQPAWLSLPSFQIKLGFVGVLYLYHFSLHYIHNQLKKGIKKYTSTQLRIWNEVATIILIAVVFLIVKKDQLSWIGGVIGILSVAILLMIAIRMYKRFREKK